MPCLWFNSIFSHFVSLTQNFFSIFFSLSLSFSLSQVLLNNSSAINEKKEKKWNLKQNCRSWQWLWKYNFEKKKATNVYALIHIKYEKAGAFF